jgi:hypothetical protein
MICVVCEQKMLQQKSYYYRLGKYHFLGLRLTVFRSTYYIHNALLNLKLKRLTFLLNSEFAVDFV